MCNNPVDPREFNESLRKLYYKRPSVRLASRNLKVPCGNCLGCRIDNMLLWSARCNYELYKSSSSFVTFTYNKYFVPKNEKGDMTLRFDEFQKLIDNLRHKVKGVNTRYVRSDFAYFASGEYGGLFNRPHFHALFFGLDFQKSAKIIRDSWPYGFAKVLPILNGGVRYVVDYFTKEKVSGELADKLYDSKGIERPFVSQSRSLGAELFFDHRDEIRRGDDLKLGSRIIPVPTYYRNLYSKFDDSEIISRFKNNNQKYLDIVSDSKKAGYSDVDQYLIDIRRANEKTLESKLRNKGIAVVSSYEGYRSFDDSLSNFALAE